MSVLKNKEEFRIRFENGEFDEELKNFNTAEDVVEFAKELGYELTTDDVLTAKLDKDTLASIAGGKGSTTNNNTTNHNNVISGNSNTQITF